MVAEDSCYDPTMASLKVQRIIPIVDVSSYFTTFCYVTIRKTAVESISPTVMIAVVASLRYSFRPHMKRIGSSKSFT